MIKILIAILNTRLNSSNKNKKKLESIKKYLNKTK